MDRRAFILLAAAAASPAAAHHGYMRWDKENPVAIEGWISKEMDGFPHWEIWVRVESQDWEVDVGDQFQLERAGLSPDGREFQYLRKIRVEGYRPQDEKIFRILPIRIILDEDEVYEINVKE